MKLPKAKFGLSTKNKFIPFELTVKVSTEFKFFYVSEELPEQLRDKVYGVRQYFDSFQSLEGQVESLIADFEVELIEETKTQVILYAIETRDDWRAQSIDFRWVVAQKVEIGHKKGERSVRYYTEEKRSGHHVGANLTELSSSAFERDFLEMAWTNEREAWFKGMDATLEKLIHQLKIGFGKTPETLARKISQGAQFLLSGSSDAT